MPLTEAGAALLAAGINAAGGAATAGIQAGKNKKLTKLAADLNREQWERELAYNDPSAQMARLRSAGLNAHLVYGGSGGSAAGNSSVGSPEIPFYQSDVPNVLGDAFQTGLNTYLSLKHDQNETNKTQSDIQTARVNDAFTIQNTLNKQVEHSNLLIQSDLLREQMTNLMENTKIARLNQIAIQISNAKNEEERKQLLRRYEHENTMQTYQIQEAEARLHQMAVQDLFTQSQTKKIGYEIENMIKDGKLKELTALEKSFGLEKGKFDFETQKYRVAQGTDRFTGYGAMAVDAASALTKSLYNAYQTVSSKFKFNNSYKPLR